MHDIVDFLYTKIYIDNSMTAKKTKTASKAPNSKQKKKKNAEKNVHAENVIYIGHIPPDFSEKPLTSFLSQFGTTKHFVLSRSPKTGRSRGYAFAQFTDAQGAQEASRELHGFVLGGRSLVSHVMEDDKVSPFMWRRWDQLHRIHIDHTRRVKGYTPAVRIQPRNTVSAITEHLRKMIEMEKKHNEALKRLGIDYVFNGFQAQEGILVQRKTEILPQEE